MREINFDGIVGPTHNFGGLSPGNVASSASEGAPANPRAAALEGLRKMRTLRELGVGQAVLPPHPRPSLTALRQLGFRGTDDEMLARAGREDELLVRLCSSAAAMWAANAATVAPSADTADARVHLTVANLVAMFHRSLEAPTTLAVLRKIFADRERFVVHAALPGGSQLADEGGANHIRLVVPGRPAVHVFGYGRRAWSASASASATANSGALPRKHPARQTLEASASVARVNAIDPAQLILAQQHPEGIDAGAFHTDVLATGNERFLMLHELAFLEGDGVIEALRARLGDELHVELVSELELPVAEAVRAYPFNAQIVTLPDDTMAIIAPVESRENPAARALLERVVSGDGPVRRLDYLDLAESMRNGGGPACLRLRVPLTGDEEAALGAKVMFTVELEERLIRWVEHHYRDRLLPEDLADPSLARAGMVALDELTRILGLGSVYDFQRPG